MKKNSFVIWLVLPFLFACQHTITTSNINNTCDQGAIRLLADFETSRMDECIALDNNHFEITLIPENTPINHSPWYAFKAVANSNTNIKITMKVSGDGKNRYLPKVSQDMQNWRVHPHTMQDNTLTFSLTLSPQPIYISAQEIINNQYYIDWAKNLQQHHSVTHNELGKSLQGRSIYKIESKKNNLPWLVILGRLHPPEVTGALALFPFVETLLADNTLARSFRQQYNILVIPNLNPDGVALGNWRHNANGVDLNRDWITLKQPETRLVHQYLQNMVTNGESIKFAIDFHSTKYDVFYTMPVTYDVQNRYLVKHWLMALDKALPHFDVIEKPGNKPNAGVSKQYFADNYHVHAITYEMGDESDRQHIKQVANHAAITLMQTLLSNVDHNKE